MANSVFCVNTHSKEFKDTAKRLDVSEGQLESTLHEYFNREDITDKETYPSDEYLKEQWYGKPFVGSEEQVELLDKYYSKPILAETQTSARALVEHLSQFFPADSIGIKQKNNGSFEIKVNDYTVEIANIKKKAIADGTFMKAPNGKDSNLNEQQWLQVRTRAFKAWFGDWEKDPTNASKVVDENSEPLIVYHNSRVQFDRFSYEYVEEPESGFFFSSDVKYAEQYGIIQYPIFLNVRTPIDAGETKLNHKNLSTILRQYKGNLSKVDGIIGNDSLDDTLIPSEGWEVMIYQPNQAKSAVNNDGTFTTEDNNIYQEGERQVQNQTRDTRLDELIKKEDVSVDDLLSLIDSSSEYSGILELLRTKGERLLNGIQVKLIEGNQSGLFDKSRAFYNAEDRTIYINTLSNYRSGRADSVIMHEVMHAVTVNRILGNRAYRVEFDRIISEYQRKFFNIRYSKRGLNKEMASHYMEEFIADVWSNIDTINNLKSIKVNTKQTLWDKIKNFFTKIFKGSDGTLMAQASDAIYRLLDQPELVSARGNYREGETFEVSTAENIDIQQDFQNRISFIPYKRTGEVIDSTNKGKNICTSTQMLCVEMISDAFNGGDMAHNVKVWPISIWAKSPLEDSIIDHSVTLVRVNGEFYIFDMPQSEFIKPTGNTFTEHGKTFNEGTIGEYKPRLISVDAQSISSAYNISGEKLDDTIKGIQSKIDDLLTRESFNITINTQPQIENTQAKAPQSESQRVLEQVREKNQSFFQKQAKNRRQFDAMMDSDIITSSDIEEAVMTVAHWISDQITSIQENPETIYHLFDTTFKKTNDWKTEEDKQKDINEVKKRSRKEIVEHIGIETLKERAKHEIFESPDISDDVQTLRQVDFFKNNLEGLMLYISQRISSIEDFVLKSVDEEGVESHLAEVNDENFEDNGAQDRDTLNETTRDMTEHWAVESRTLDVWRNATQEVRNALMQCYVLEEDYDSDGKVKKDENGNIITRRKANKFAQAQHVNPLEATQQILHWVQGSINMIDMINALKEKKDSNLWVSQIISRLEDNSGKEADFKSQFFRVFYKPFQSYSIQIKNKKTGKNYTQPANTKTALNDAVDLITVRYNVGSHPLFSSDGIEAQAFSNFKRIVDNLHKGVEEGSVQELLDDESKRFVLARAIANVTNILGYPTTVDEINKILTKDTFTSMSKALDNILSFLTKNYRNKEYNPFKYGKESILGYLKSFLKPLISQLEDIELGSFYSGGKMYQGFVTPSYTKKMMDKFLSKQEVFEKFLKEEFAKSEWFVTDVNATPEQLRTRASLWRHAGLARLAAMSQEERQKFFGHKTLLNYHDKEYMRDMTASEYAMSVLTEFASIKPSETDSVVPAWYVFPMESNKPSEEFFKYFRFTGETMEDNILMAMRSMAYQEMSRIQTVKMRNKKKGEEGFIENFDDKNGKKFVFLPWLNTYLEGGSKADTEVGKELQKKLEGKKANEEIIHNAIDEDTRTFFDNAVSDTIAKFKNRGIYDSIKTIENVQDSEAGINNFIKEFVWNHILAENSFLQLTVTDLAYYKNSEDLQKRLAQLHSPGLIGDRFATDYNGVQVSDGYFRHFYLEDLEGVKANVVDNLKAYFEQKKAQLPEASRDAYEAFAESFLSNYDNFTVTDGQAFSTLTGLRKKSFVYGNWAREMEKIWEDFRDGKFNLSDINTASQVKKPFTYSQIMKSSSVEEAPIRTLKMGIQYKDSEALLLMANALIGETDTGRPNIMRAIMRVMENSHYTTNENGERVYKQNGLDTAIFHSGVKTGYMTGINLNQFLEDPNGEAKAIAELEKLFDPTTVDGYNPNYVHAVMVEDVSQQLEVPAHFRDQQNIWGSQERAIIPSAVETTFMGEEVNYDIPSTDGTRRLTAEQFQREYQETAAQNIRESIDELCEELGIGDYYTNRTDRNVALAKILQKEIISSPRYGTDLLLACTVDENTGEFRIPLGDPVQSKRVEQLINSIIKNHVNKQKFEGGPSVLVTNWGRTKKLNIIFKDKNGNLLPTRSEWEKNNPGGNYDDYLADNQYSVAWYECYASPASIEWLRNFMDKDGFVDVEAIEMIDGGEELLKMIGYRIPTEDMYSIAPFKVVGILPKEVGDGFMQPWEMPAITGEDHDVDKKNLLRKKIYIAKRFTWNDESLSDVEAAQAYVKANRKSLANDLIRAIPGEKFVDVINAVLNSKLSGINAEEQLMLNRIKANVDDQTVDRLNKLRDEDKNFEQKENRILAEGDERAEKQQAKLRKQFEIRRNEELKDLYKTSNLVKNPAVKSYVEWFLSTDVFQPTVGRSELYKALKRAYMNTLFKLVEPTVNVSENGTVTAFGDTVEERKNARNNHIFDMTWSLLTHPASTEKILNTGTFEPQKNLGYKVTAKKTHPEMSWEEIDRMTTAQAKEIAFGSKYLPDFTTQMDYYENNSVAGNVLGQAAVQRVAHAILKNKGYGIIMPDNVEFTLAGHKFSGFVPIDNEFAYSEMTVNTEGQTISTERLNNEAVGKTLGNHVGASADAVKDPVLNLLNINVSTFKTYSTMIRFGVPFKVAGLMISSRIFDEVLAEQKKRGLTKFTKLSDVIDERISKFNQNYSFDNSQVADEELTLNEIQDALVADTNTEEGARIAYKILNIWREFEGMTTAAQPLTVATRFNSVSSAVGPQVVDNRMWEYKANNADNADNKYKLGQGVRDNDGAFFAREVTTSDVLEDNPILQEFSRSYDIASELLKDMPASSADFAYLLTKLPTGLKGSIMNDRKLLLSLSDFYQSYLLLKSGVINPNNLNYFVNTFPKEFIAGDYKTKYKGNAFIDAIKPDTRGNKSGEEMLVLKIDTSGVDQSEVDSIKLGWAKFHKQEPEMSRKLFEYNFALAGIGYSPKTFMNCLPTQVKEQIPEYIETYRKFPNLSVTEFDNIIDQFVRNNWNERKLVPWFTDEKVQTNEKTGKIFIESTNPELKGVRYFRTNSTMFQLLSEEQSVGSLVTRTYVPVEPLGNNGSYLEINTTTIKEPLKKVTKDPVPQSAPRGDTNGASDNTDNTSQSRRTRVSVEDDIRWLRSKLVDQQGEPVVNENLFNMMRRGQINPRNVQAYVEGIVKRLRDKGINVTEKEVMEIRKRFCV